MELHRIIIARRNDPRYYTVARVLILARDKTAAEVAVARQARSLTNGDDPDNTFVVHDGVEDADAAIVLHRDGWSPTAPIYGAPSVAQLLSLATTATPTKTPEQVVAELEAVARQKWPESRDYQFRHGYVSGRIDALDATTATPAAREATVDPAQAVAQGLDELERRHGHEAFVKAFNDRIGAWCAAAPRPVIAFISEPTAAQFDAAMAPFSVSAPKLTYGEPWRVSESELDPQMMWGPSSFVFNAGQNANATRKVMERIVACVNACASVDTDTLKAGLMRTLLNSLQRLTKERDKVNDLLKDFVLAAQMDASTKDWGEDLDSAFQAAQDHVDGENQR